MYLFVVHKIMNKYLKIKIHPLWMDFFMVNNYIIILFNNAKAPIPGNPATEETAKENSFKGIFIPVYGSAMLIKIIDITPTVSALNE